MKTLIQITNIEKHYGARTILSEANLNIAENQKIGVIGRNGAGKTTLFKIIAGDENADTGDVYLHPELRLSYMEQQPPFEENDSVLSFLTRYTKCEEWECGKVLGKFNIKNERLHAKISDLAGGYRMRVKLAAMLLHEPNFLLLDEPSNYLDLSTLLHLERFLNDFKGGFLLISHDREFLERTCDMTLEVENGKSFLFPGNVLDYLAFKEDKKEQALRYNKNVEQRQKELESFITRFRAKNTKAKQAQSKQKQLMRLKKIDVESEGRVSNIMIPNANEKKGFALIAKNISIGYPDKTVAEAITFEVERGAKVAILGDNGEGKSTLLKTIIGELKALDGEISFANDITVSYYAQHVYETIDEKESVYSYLESEAAEDITNEDILRMAGCFLFKGEDVEKKCSVLSGGERARLSLASILLKKSNVLLLDEPTNHLDFETVEALAIALNNFNGTVFFISHDRTFVSTVATEIMEIKDGKVYARKEDYDSYVWRLQKESVDDYEKKEEKEKGVKEKKDKKDKSDYDLRKEIQSRIKKESKALLTLEKEIEALKKEKENLLKDFAENPLAYSKDREIRLKKIEESVLEKEELWLVKHENVDKDKESLKELKGTLKNC